MLMVLKQILLVSVLGKVQKIVWRMYILILGCKLLRLKYLSLSVISFYTQRNEVPTKAALGRGGKLLHDRSK